MKRVLRRFGHDRGFSRLSLIKDIRGNARSYPKNLARGTFQDLGFPAEKFSGFGFSRFSRKIDQDFRDFSRKNRFSRFFAEFFSGFGIFRISVHFRIWIFAIFLKDFRPMGQQLAIFIKFTRELTNKKTHIV